MPVVTKSLPSATVVSRQHELEANIQGVVRFYSSVNFAESTSQVSILSLVNEHHLWIARNSGCRINLSVLLEGEFVCGKEKVSRIVHWIENYELWNVLGIRLRYCGDLSKLLASELPFSIHHPDLTSSLVAPDGAPNVNFKLATCLVYIRHKEPPKERVSKRKRSPGHREKNQSPHNDSCSEPAGFYDGLSSLDREAIDSFVLDLGKYETPSAYPKQDDSTVPDSLSIDSIEQILQASLYTFIDGKPKQTGIQVLNGGPSSCLTRIAPGVFDAVFLKALSERTPMVSVVANSLAYMKNAESPGLRNRIGLLEATVANETSRMGMFATSTNLQTRDCLEIQTWNMLLQSLITSHRSFRGRNAPHTSKNTKDTEECIPVLRSSDLTPVSSQMTTNPNTDDSPHYGHPNLADQYSMVPPSPQLSCADDSETQRYYMMDYSQPPEIVDESQVVRNTPPGFYAPYWSLSSGPIEFINAQQYTYDDEFYGHVDTY